MQTRERKLERKSMSLKRRERTNRSRPRLIERFASDSDTFEKKLKQVDEEVGPQFELAIHG